MLLGLPTWGRDRRQRAPSQSRLAIRTQNTLHNGPKVPSPALTFDVPASEHHRIHLLQGQLGGFWDFCYTPQTQSP